MTKERSIRKGARVSDWIMTLMAPVSWALHSSTSMSLLFYYPHCLICLRFIPWWRCDSFLSLSLF